jgi:predicted regulator of Ras-like GTPase activity (Roadblock/LC7/MglB family)
MEEEIFVDSSFEDSLEDLIRKVPGLVGLVLADKHGLPVSSSFPEERGVMEASAMSAVAVDAAISITRHLDLGGFENVTFSFENYYLYVSSLADRNANLLALAQKDVNLGLLEMTLEQTKKIIERILRDFIKV